MRMEKGRITRDKILKGALDIICSHGVTGLSASRLARLSGISKSTVFHHFPVLEEIPFIILRQTGTLLTEEISSRDFQSFSDFLSFLGDLTTAEECTSFYKAFLSFYQSAMYHDEYKKAIESCSSAYREIITRQVLEFYPTLEERAGEYAELIYTAMDGIGMHYLLSENRESFRKSWTLFSEALTEKLERSGI